MRFIVFENKFRNRKIGIKRGIEMLTGLEFTGFIQLERLWWWRNFIEYSDYIPIKYPQQGFLSIARLNDTHKHRNTIRVYTRQQSNSDKRELFVLKQLYGKEKERYDRKCNRQKKSRYSV